LIGIILFIIFKKKKSSSVVEKIFVAAHTKGTKFRVIVVDGRPHLEGKALLSRLVKHGLQCSYVLINAISYVMKEVSKVFVGAHCMFNNGTFLSRVGTAMVAAAAYSINVPLIVCCQSHKFADKVQLDSFVFNELGSILFFFSFLFFSFLFFVKVIFFLFF